MSNNTRIKFKRSSDYSSDRLDVGKEGLLFGEPLLIDAEGEKFLVLGPATTGSNDLGETNINNCIFIKGMSKLQASKAVMYDDNGILTDLSGNPLKASRVSSKVLPTATSVSSKYFIVCQTPNEQGGDLYTFDYSPYGVFIDNKGVMHGAAWNDYAESRNCEDTVECGTVVCEDGHGNLVPSTERMQPCAYVVSDTYGFTLGSGNVNIAVAGKALVFVEDEVELGDCLTAGENGKAVKMTRQEIANYPDRILGTVVEIPEYSTYNDVEVNGRVWVRVR